VLPRIKSSGFGLSGRTLCCPTDHTVSTRSCVQSPLADNKRNTCLVMTRDRSQLYHVSAADLGSYYVLTFKESQTSFEWAYFVLPDGSYGSNPELRLVFATGLHFKEVLTLRVLKEIPGVLCVARGS
jgi:hypothetical protein